MHGSGWGDFDPTHHGGSKKIQPNPHGSSWTHVFDKLLLLLLLNWVEKNININILKKTQRLVSINSLKANNTND